MRGGRTETADYKLLEAAITLWPLPSFIEPIRINAIKLNLRIVHHVYVPVIVFAVVFSIKFYEFYATLLSGIQFESVTNHVCM